MATLSAIEALLPHIARQVGQMAGPQTRNNHTIEVGAASIIGAGCRSGFPSLDGGAYLMWARDQLFYRHGNSSPCPS